MNGDGREIMVDKKQIILDKMENELNRAINLPNERIAENRPLTVQYIYQKLKESFGSH